MTAGNTAREECKDNKVRVGERALGEILLERMDRDLKVRQFHLEQNKERLQHDRKDLRHRVIKTWIIGGAIALAPTLYLLTAYHYFGPKGIKEDYAAMVRVQGPIASNTRASAGRLVPALNMAFKDDLAKGVVIHIDSPGGSPVQSSIIHDRIIELRKKYPEKKVIAVGEDYMTSGAYFIATGAPKICVNRSTLAGSIGVISQSIGIDPDKYLEKYGFERRIYTAGSQKASIDTFAPVTADQKAKMSEIMASMHKHFISSVQETRKDKINVADNVAFTGAFWTGDKAMEMGLVDGLCDLQSVLENEFGVSVAADYTPSPGIFDSLRKSFTTETGEVLGNSLLGLLMTMFDHTGDHTSIIRFE